MADMTFSHGWNVFWSMIFMPPNEPSPWLWWTQFMGFYAAYCLYDAIIHGIGAGVRWIWRRLTSDVSSSEVHF